jgi:hypothetical protein
MKQYFDDNITSFGYLFFAVALTIAFNRVRNLSDVILVLGFETLFGYGFVFTHRLPKVFEKDLLNWLKKRGINEFVFYLFVAALSVFLIFLLSHILSL